MVKNARGVNAAGTLSNWSKLPCWGADQTYYQAARQIGDLYSINMVCVRRCFLARTGGGILSSCSCLCVMLLLSAGANRGRVGGLLVAFQTAEEPQVSHTRPGGWPTLLCLPSKTGQQLFCVHCLEAIPARKPTSCVVACAFVSIRTTRHSWSSAKIFSSSCPTFQSRTLSKTLAGQVQHESCMRHPLLTPDLLMRDSFTRCRLPLAHCSLPYAAACGWQDSQPGSPRNPPAKRPVGDHLQAWLWGGGCLGSLPSAG